MKNGQRCNKWKNYDSSLKAHIVKAEGCRPPYWKGNSKTCNSTEEMMNIMQKYLATAQSVGKDAAINDFPPPCRQVQSIGVDLSEIDKVDAAYRDSFHKEKPNISTFGLYVNFVDTTYKVNIQYLICISKILHAL